MTLSALKQKINIKYFMVAYLGALLIFSSLYLGLPMRLAEGLLIVVLYACFDLMWTYVRDKIWYLPVSSMISGLILSLVAAADPPVLLIIVLPLLAVLGKQLLHFGKMRHVFNPASFALLVTAFFTPSISWWGVTWGLPVLVIVGVVGIFILWRQSKWRAALSFLFTYIVLSALLFLMSVPLQKIPDMIRAQIFDGTTLFFSTVMLIEPITSGFPQKNQQMFYGFLVGFFVVLVTFFMPYIAGIAAGYPDPLILGLLLGNLTASLLFLPNAKHQ